MAHQQRFNVSQRGSYSSITNYSCAIIDPDSMDIGTFLYTSNESKNYVNSNGFNEYYYFGGCLYNPGTLHIDGAKKRVHLKYTQQQVLAYECDDVTTLPLRNETKQYTIVHDFNNRVNPVPIMFTALGYIGNRTSDGNYSRVATTRSNKLVTMIVEQKSASEMAQGAITTVSKFLSSCKSTNVNVCIKDFLTTLPYPLLSYVFEAFSNQGYMTREYAVQQDSLWAEPVPLSLQQMDQYLDAARHILLDNSPDRDISDCVLHYSNSGHKIRIVQH